MSLFWKVLETVDYAVLRATGGIPKPMVNRTARANASSTETERPVEAKAPEADARASA